MMSPPMPLEAEKMLRSELNLHEKLIWIGQPLANRAGRGSLPLVLFGIPWTAFSIFWVVMALSIGSHVSSGSSPFSFLPFLFPLFGVPFVLIGVWMLSSPYWMRRKAQKIVYALTDRRALILSPTWRGGVSVLSIAPEQLGARERVQNPDGSGSLIFTQLTTTRRRAGPDGGTYAVTVGFENIADVRDVDTLLDRTYSASQDG